MARQLLLMLSFFAFGPSCLVFLVVVDVVVVVVLVVVSCFSFLLSPLCSLSSVAPLLSLLYFCISAVFASLLMKMKNIGRGSPVDSSKKKFETCSSLVIRDCCVRDCYQLRHPAHCTYSIFLTPICTKA